MQRNIIITTALLLLFSSVSLSGQEKNKKDIETVRFETSIDCENCVNTIMKNVSQKGSEGCSQVSITAPKRLPFSIRRTKTTLNS
ncbi:MAG: hypothetical protein U5L72_04555 [Bacteroidales bacterium]|nr:hypothetical protein [Bacteroidales bacterium]